MADVFTHHISRPTTSLDGEDLLAMIRKIGEMCYIPWTERNPTGGYKDLQTISAKVLRFISRGSINIRKPEYAENHTVHLGQLRKAVGAGNGARTIETYIPILTMIMALLIALQFKSAYKEQERG
jgi:hypothetical protein